nr:pentapeptide repeat-containing protein [uncultured Aminipila sp.]
MIQPDENKRYNELLKTLSINCEECCGICCTALYYTKMDGFPEDKAAGKPCGNLRDDFKCSIHNNLVEYKLKGCMAYDCFGAGQKVTQEIYGGLDWKKNPEVADQMFQVFLIVYQLHQMLWYLIQARRIIADNSMKNDINNLIEENGKMTQMRPEGIIKLDWEQYRDRVNRVLKETCKAVHSEITDNNHSIDCMGQSFKKQNLDGKDFSMKLLIAANFEGCSLNRTNFLGADMRDTNFRDTDLSKSLFLTQMQINTAMGNCHTKLPEYLTMPETWLQ